MSDLLQAPCGLDCAQCSIYLRTEEELAYWRDRGIDPEKIRCDGCRAPRSGCRWSPDCAIFACCVEQQGLLYCSDCSEFPCAELEAWADAYSHHRAAMQNLWRMRREKDVGSF